MTNRVGQTRPTAWQRWVRQPQGLWLRKAIFQIHLWTGIAVGGYLFMISLTGSVLVYRTELSKWATPPPLLIVVSGPLLTDAQLTDAALRAYPGYKVTNLFRPRKATQPVNVWLQQGSEKKQRLFDPYTGRDLQDSVPAGIRAISWTLDLHDNLLGGPTGRLVNGAGSLLTLVLGLTGLVIWWPGIRSWRRSLALHRRVGWKRLTWDVHSAVGFWSFVFILLFGITGAYLSFPNAFSQLADAIVPETDANAGNRWVDVVLYWLAYAHFGRFGGWKTRIPWVIFGLAPAALFVTGAMLWWNRVVWPRLRPSSARHAR